jgi:hypothetical protein
VAASPLGSIERQISATPSGAVARVLLSMWAFPNELASAGGDRDAGAINAVLNGGERSRRTVRFLIAAAKIGRITVGAIAALSDVQVWAIDAAVRREERHAVATAMGHRLDWAGMRLVVRDAIPRFLAVQPKAEQAVLAGPIRGADGFVVRVRIVAGIEPVAAIAGFRRCVRRANVVLVIRLIDMEVGAFSARFDWLR